MHKNTNASEESGAACNVLTILAWHHSNDRGYRQVAVILLKQRFSCFYPRLILKSELMTFSVSLNACPASRYQFQQNDCNLLEFLIVIWST